MKFIPENIYGWDGYVWTQGDITVGIVPRLGGRIMSLKYRGEEIFFTQKEHRGETFELRELVVDKEQFGFRVWGGDKTWVAPEKLWLDNIPPLDLDAGPYDSSVDDKKIVMTSAVCRETGLRITRKVEIQSDNRVLLTETIKNENHTPSDCGIWNVTQLLRPFDIYVPAPIKKVRLYEDEAFKYCRPEKYLSEEGGWTKIACFDEAHFKFGCQVLDGEVRAVRQLKNGTVTFSKKFLVDLQATYAHGSNIEVYNSPFHNYCEVEIHSPFRNLGPGQSFSHQQEWQLGP